MKCPSEIELNEFAEDRLDSRRRWEVQEHLTQCAGCRADLEGLQWAGEQLAVLETALADEEHPAEEDLAALAEGKASPDRKAELLSHLSNCAECAWLFGRLPRKERTLALPTRWYSLAAAAIILVAVGLFAFNGLFSGHPGPTSAPTAKMASVKSAAKVAALPAEAPKHEAQTAKAVPTPVTRPAPTMLAQAPTHAVAGSPKSSEPRAGGAIRARHSVASRHWRHQEDNMQIAMNLPAPAPTPQASSEAVRVRAMEDKVFAMDGASRPATAAPGMPGAAGGSTHTMSAMALHPGTGTARGPVAAVEPAEPAAPAAVAGPDHVAGAGAGPQPQSQVHKPQPLKKTPLGLNDPQEKEQTKAAHARLSHQELTALKQKVSKSSLGKSIGKSRLKSAGHVGQHGTARHAQHHHIHATHLAHASVHHHLIAQHAPPGPSHA